MSHEHFSPEQQQINRFVADIPWPTTVLPTDLAHVEERRGAGRTLFAAISDVMLDEVTEIGEGLFNVSVHESERSEFRLFTSSGLDFYNKPALAMWSVDEIARKGELDSDFLEEIMQRSSAAHRTASGLRQMLDPQSKEGIYREIGRLFDLSDEKREDIQKLINKDEAKTLADKVNWQATAHTLAEKLFSGTSVQEVVDVFTQTQMASLPEPSSPESQLYFYLIQRVALQHGRDRFLRLYNAVRESEQTRADHVQDATLEDVSGSSAVTIVEAFLQSLSSQREEESQKIRELHELMRKVGKLSETLTPYLEKIDSEDSESQLDLLPSGITTEEAWDVEPIGKVSQDEDGAITISVDDGLGELRPDVGVYLSHHPGNNLDELLEGTQHIDRFGFTERDHLAISFHLDAQTASQVESRQRLRGRRYSPFIKTTFFFDAEGKYIKTSAVPREVDDERAPIGLVGGGKALLSEMTDQDFTLVSYALTNLERVLFENLERVKGEQGDAS